MNITKKHRWYIDLSPSILALTCALCFAYTVTTLGIVSSLGWLVALAAIVAWQWTIILWGRVNARSRQWQKMCAIYKDALVDARRNSLLVTDELLNLTPAHTFDGSRLGAMWADLSDVRATNGAKTGETDANERKE